MTSLPSKGQVLARNALPAYLANASPFEKWWFNVGSGIAPLPGEDAESFAHRVCEIAWDTGYSSRHFDLTP